MLFAIQHEYTVCLQCSGEGNNLHFLKYKMIKCQDLTSIKKKHFKSKSKKGLGPWLPELIISKTNEVVF